MAERLELEAVLDMQATGRLAAQLHSRAEAVELDASSVTHLGALAAQLLLSAQIPDPAGAHEVKVAEASAEFTDGLNRLGIDPSLVLA